MAFPKWPLSQINYPTLRTVQSFCKLVSKDRFLKLKHFALKMRLVFGSTYVRESTFSILWS